MLKDFFFFNQFHFSSRMENINDYDNTKEKNSIIKITYIGFGDGFELEQKKKRFSIKFIVAQKPITELMFDAKIKYKHSHSF